MTITDFYEAIKKIVRTYPTMQLKCWQPQAFAVLPEASDLNSPNLGKVICDKNRPYFYSKLWEAKGFTPNAIEYEFPLVVIYEENIVKKKAFSNISKSCYSITLSVLDQYKEDCGKLGCVGCANRTKMEIYNDTEVILNQILQKIGKDFSGHINSVEDLTVTRFVGIGNSNLYGNSVTFSVCVKDCTNLVELYYQDLNEQKEVIGASCC